MNRKIWKIVFVAVMWLCVGNFAAAAQTAARKDCFAFETLPAQQRKRAEDLLLKALDSEALYTLAGGIKPMSSGFQSLRVAVQLPRVEPMAADQTVRELAAKKPEELSETDRGRLSRAKSAIERRETLERIEDTRRILEKWRCGDEIFADVHHFARQFEGKRFLDAVVFSRPSLRRMLREKADFFSRWGITENAQPLGVLYAVEYEETSARNAGYGFLFGYPNPAVRFFVNSADEETFTGKFVERDFYSIPTFERATNGFVYAVPKGYAESESDRVLKTEAEAILANYRRRRAEYIGAGKKGVVELLRDWFCDRSGSCSPSAVR